MEFLLARKTVDEHRIGRSLHAIPFADVCVSLLPQTGLTQVTFGCRSRCLWRTHSWSENFPVRTHSGCLSVRFVSTKDAFVTHKRREAANFSAAQFSHACIPPRGDPTTDTPSPAKFRFDKTEIKPPSNRKFKIVNPLTASARTRFRPPSYGLSAGVRDRIPRERRRPPTAPSRNP